MHLPLSLSVHLLFTKVFRQTSDDAQKYRGAFDAVLFFVFVFVSPDASVEVLLVQQKTQKKKSTEVSAQHKKNSLVLFIPKGNFSFSLFFVFFNDLYFFLSFQCFVIYLSEAKTDLL